MKIDLARLQNLTAFVLDAELSAEQVAALPAILKAFAAAANNGAEVAEAMKLDAFANSPETLIAREAQKEYEALAAAFTNMARQAEILISR